VLNLLLFPQTGLDLSFFILTTQVPIATYTFLLIATSYTRFTGVAHYTSHPLSLQDYFTCLLRPHSRSPNRPTVIIFNSHTPIMKTFAIAAVLAASAAATPTAATQKRANITPVTVKGNGKPIFSSPPIVY
jgi:hypothetical protein